jgi:hypothetical protein
VLTQPLRALLSTVLPDILLRPAAFFAPAAAAVAFAPFWLLPLRERLATVPPAAAAVPSLESAAALRLALLLLSPLLQ